MSNLYNRKCYVTFGPIRQLSIVEGIFITSGISPLNIIGGWDNLSVSNLGWPFVALTSPPRMDSRGYSDLRVSFNVKKTLESKENEADIEIYNISKDSYKLLQKINETYVVQLSVGYSNARNSLFLGNIENSYYYKDGSNWILKIEGKDGQENIQDSIVNKSYREGFSIKNVLLDMIESSNIIPKGAYNEAKKWIEENLTTDKKTENGLTISGRLIDEVNKILGEIGAFLSIQDEKAQIIYNNSNTNDDIVLLSPSSGLIGSPIDKGSEEGIEFRCLLIPLLKPGSLVKIQSKTIDDYYRIDNIIYKGDTYGNDWECRCEATRPSNIFTELPEIKYYNSLDLEKELTATWKTLI
jgi:hypothetical protein